MEHDGPRLHAMFSKDCAVMDPCGVSAADDTIKALHFLPPQRPRYQVELAQLLQTGHWNFALI